MSIDKEYLEHKVFGQLTDYADFYNSLGLFTMGWLSQGTQSIINLDTYVYSSIKGTLESIKDILKKGRINDSYALLRKYYDSTIINIYSNLYLLNNFSIENFIVTKIDNWRKGTEKLPEYRVMSQYIRDSERLAPITKLLYKDKTYKNIRERCNDNTHYNYYCNILLNDNQIFLYDRRQTALDNFSNDIEDIFIQHLSLLFYFNEHYMMATDYTDSLESGITPEDGSEYFVAPYIQNIFDKVIKVKRIDIATEIKSKTTMKLD